MINKILSIFDEYAQHYNFSGVALIKQGNTPLFEYASGYAHKGFGIQNKMSTMFDTASITKLFTAAGIVLLENNGVLNFTDKIHDIIDLSGTKIPTDVEIHHLLTHTSGIADDADEENGEDYAALFKSSPNYAIRDNIDFLQNFAYKEPNFKAGSNIKYNNCAFILLGLVIEKSTGQGYREFISENIFKPFGMGNTLFSAKDDTDLNIAEGYYHTDNQKGLQVWKKNIYSFPPIGTADSGAYTNVFDLDRFIRNIKNNPVFEKMLNPQCKISRASEMGNIRYGYAFEFVERDNEIYSIYKEGCNPGVSNILCYYPKSDITFSILSNQDCNVWKLQREIEFILLESKGHMNTLASAFQYAETGKIEEWVHLFLTDEGDNILFSDGLKLEKRYYFGPLKFKLDMFDRCCGPEVDNKYVVDRDAFEKHVSVLQNRFENGWDMPPLIVNYCSGSFELNDGNHRYEALKRSGIDEYYFIV